MLCARVFNSGPKDLNLSVYGVGQQLSEDKENILAQLTTCIKVGDKTKKSQRITPRKSSRVKCVSTKSRTFCTQGTKTSMSRRPLGDRNGNIARYQKDNKGALPCWGIQNDMSYSNEAGLKALSPWRLEAFSAEARKEADLTGSMLSRTGSLGNLSLASRASRVGRLGIRGEVKVDIKAASSGKIKVQLSEAKGLKHAGEKDMPCFFTEVSVRRGGTILRSYVTNILEGTHPVFNESLHVDVAGNDDHRARLVISIMEIRNSGSCVVGCMSFGVKHLKRKSISGWYYLLNDEIGKRKHLRVKNIAAGVASSTESKQNDLSRCGNVHTMKRAVSSRPNSQPEAAVPRKNMLERVAIYNRHRMNFLAQDSAYQSDVMSRMDMPDGSTGSRSNVQNIRATRTSQEKLLNIPLMASDNTRMDSIGTSFDLMSKEHSVPMSLSDLKVDRRDTRDFGCNAHGATNQLNRASDRKNHRVAHGAFNLPQQPRNSAKNHQRKIDGEMQERLIELLYGDERGYYGSTQVVGSAASTMKQSGYDSSDEVQSRSTDGDSERRWDCLAAFDNFSGGKSTGSEISSETDDHSSDEESDAGSSLEESVSWQQLVDVLDTERRQYMKQTSIKHVSSINRLHSLGYISTPKPHILVLGQQRL